MKNILDKTIKNKLEEKLEKRIKKIEEIKN